jgi:SAM-dependent methyltransferase
VNEHDIWSALYRSDVPREQTARECDFIEGFLPLESHSILLDLACETGRHSIELASRGYSMTGVDVDPKALEVARTQAAKAGVTATFIEADLRHLDALVTPFDGTLLFWQSFGFFDYEAQIGIFKELRRLLRVGGRLILDLHNRLYFVQGMAPPAVPDDFPDAGMVTGIREKEEPSFLGYEEDLGFEARRPVALFDPHMFTPAEMAGLADNYGLRLIASCSHYNPQIPATPEHPRMQLVFEKG